MESCCVVRSRVQRAAERIKIIRRMSCAIKWMQKVSLFDDNCPEYVLYKKSTFFIYITSFILHQLPKLRVAGSNPVFRSESRGKKRR